MIRIISWNINGRSSIWNDVTSLGVDVALLQEAPAPPASVAESVDAERDCRWETAGAKPRRPWRTTVAGLSDRVRLARRPTTSIEHASRGELAVSLPGSLSIAEVEVLQTGETFTLVSMYGVWERPDVQTRSSWIYADASVHRMISDLSALIGSRRGHRIIAAGDLNILLGYGEHGDDYWRRRYETVFSRMEAIGLKFVGPQSPEGGLQAYPWPDELPKNSRSVPTYRTKRNLPGSATRQLDFVFVSGRLKDRLRVRALNGVAEWGPSDHCRILIEVS